ncbi:Organic cation transporter protein [Nymphon striatum]|nr:Organic cation transporter protein [Nymphon striatum]
MEFSKPKRNFIETICLTADTPLSVLEDRRLRGSSFTSEFFLSIIHACQPWKLPNSQFHGRFQISKFWLSSYLCILIFNLFFMFTNITFFFLMYLHVFSYILPVMSTCSPLGFERGNEWPDLFLHMGTQHPVGMIKNKTMVGSFTNLISNWNSRRMENYLNDMNLISLFCGTQNVAMPFYAPSIDHWCSKPDHLEELSTELWKNYSLPSEETEGGKHTYSSCKQYDIDYKNISVAEYVSFMNNFKSGNRTVSEKSCSSWAYDKSFWKETIVSDWNLVCDKSVLVTVISSVYMAGMMFGLLIIPQFSDRFGRKPVILIVLLVCFVSTLGLTFSPNIIIFSVLRFVIAATDIPGTSMIFIMGQECLSERNRALWGNLSNVSFPIGTLFLTMFSYLTTNWRITQVIAIVPLIIMFILHLIIPESLRWQLSVGKYDKALKSMKVSSKLNRYTLPCEDILLQDIAKMKNEKIIEEKEKRNKKTKVTLLDLFKTPEVRIRTLITYLLWFTVAFCYYAFTLNLQDIAGNLFLNMTIASILECGGVFLSSLLLIKVGRRLPTSFLMLFSGLTILLSIAVPTRKYFYNSHRLIWLKVGLSLLGKTSISMVFAIIYLHTTEYMPTVARSIGLGSSSLFARIGAIISPYVHIIKEVTSQSVVFAIYGVMCILCGLAVLRLPETRNQPLQEFIEDAENYDYKSKRYITFLKFSVSNSIFPAIHKVSAINGKLLQAFKHSINDNQCFMIYTVDMK